jgi:hypothetical protein
MDLHSLEQSSVVDAAKIPIRSVWVQPAVNLINGGEGGVNGYQRGVIRRRRRLYGDECTHRNAHAANDRVREGETGNPLRGHAVQGARPTDDLPYRVAHSLACRLRSRYAMSIKNDSHLHYCQDT